MPHQAMFYGLMYVSGFMATILIAAFAITAISAIKRNVYWGRLGHFLAIVGTILAVFTIGLGFIYVGVCLIYP